MGGVVGGESTAAAPRLQPGTAGTAGRPARATPRAARAPERPGALAAAKIVRYHSWESSWRRRTEAELGMQLGCMPARSAWHLAWHLGGPLAHLHQ